MAITNLSFGSRLMQAIKGVAVGAVCVLLAFPILFVNEGCAVKDYKHQKDVARSVVPAASAPVDPANEGRFVHVMGQASTTELLTDRDFPVSQAAAFRLDRSVEMYQWKETVRSRTETKVGGGSQTIREPSYELVWSSTPIDSSAFMEEGRATHQNPPMPYRADSVVATSAALGDFTLPPALISAITGGSAVALSPELLAKLPADLKARASLKDGALYIAAPPAATTPQTAGGSTVVTVTTQADGSSTVVTTTTPGSDGQAPISASTTKPGGSVITATLPDAGPRLGDLRIRFTSATSPAAVTVQARQSADTFVQGAQEFRLLPGQMSVAEAKAADAAGTRARTWGVRFLGFILMSVGIMLVLAPFAVMADVIPMVGNLVRSGVFLAAVLIALPLTLITAAIAWVVYRPLVGVPLLLAAVGSVVFLVMLNARRKDAAGARPGRDPIRAAD